MSNGIADRQNEESNIKKLAAQRQLYKSVHWIEVLNFVLTVVVPGILLLFNTQSAYEIAGRCLCAFIIMCLSFYLDELQKKGKTIAACIQQEFDISVYSMDWDVELFGERKNLSAEIAKASEKIMNDKKERNKLNNWYEAKYDSLPLEEGIAACQKENYDWDAKLRERYRNLLIVIIVVIVLAVVLINLSETVLTLLVMLLQIISVFKWFLKIIFDINSDLKRMESIEREVYSTEEKSMKQLALTQKYIFENRKESTKIPDWLYSKFEKIDADHAKRVAEIQVEDNESKSTKELADKDTK